MTQAAATPEPSTLAMMMLGFAGLGYVGYRKRKQAYQPRLAAMGEDGGLSRL